MAGRGLKRVCASCGTKFYDFGKLPIICPSCKVEFTGEVKIRARRVRSSITPDTVKRSDIEKKNRESFDDLDEDDEDDDLNIDLDDDGEDENDLEGLEGDIDVDLGKNDD